MIKTFTLKSYKSKSLSGNITIPGDKSISIRAVIIASISYGNTKIFGLLESDDVKDTITALKFLGIEIRKTKVYFLVKGNGGVFSNNEKNLCTATTRKALGHKAVQREMVLPPRPSQPTSLRQTGQLIERCSILLSLEIP